jgi:WD40 repeat protein
VPTLYEILGVQPNDDADTLRSAYRRLARLHHPDVSQDPKAHEIMARINEAFETLIDPARRMEYDAMLAGGLVEPAPPPRRKPSQPKPVVVGLLKKLRGNRTPIYGLSFAPDTGRLATCAFDNEIALWDLVEGAQKQKRKAEGCTIASIRALRHGAVVGTGAVEHLLSYCRMDDEGMHTWRLPVEEWVSCASVSPDGRTIATGSVGKTLSLLEAQDGSPRVSRRAHAESITAIGWSDDGQLLATGSADASVKLWHGSNGALLSTFQAIRSAVTALSISPDNRYLAVAAVDLSIRVFNLSSGSLVKVLFGHHKPIEGLAFHPNGWLFASASRDGSVGLWSAGQGLAKLILPCSDLPVTSVAFSPDGTRLAAAGLDRTIKIFEVAAKG